MLAQATRANMMLSQGRSWLRLQGIFFPAALKLTAISIYEWDVDSWNRSSLLNITNL